MITTFWILLPSDPRVKSWLFNHEKLITTLYYLWYTDLTRTNDLFWSGRKINYTKYRLILHNIYFLSQI